MMFNRVLLSGTIQIQDTYLSGHDGLFTEISIFTHDWWQDRQDNPHMFSVPVRLSATLLEREPKLEGGMTLLVPGKQARLSVGSKESGRSPETGIDAERILIIREPPEGHQSPPGFPAPGKARAPRPFLACGYAQVKVKSQHDRPASIFP